MEGMISHSYKGWVVVGIKLLVLGVVNQEKVVIKQLEQVQARDEAYRRRLCQSRWDPSDLGDRRSRNRRGRVHFGSEGGAPNGNMASCLGGGLKALELQLHST